MARKISKRRHKPLIKKEVCRVHSVYDGDTITVEQVRYSWLWLKKDVRLIKVRLAYIDTPELRDKQAGAVQAREFLKKLIHGKRVVLEYEQLPSGKPRKGDYHRMLAVVHLQRKFFPNVNINRLLLKKGLARLYANPDNITPHHWRGLVQAESYARRRHLGIWGRERVSHKEKSSGVFWYVLLGMILGFLIGIAVK